MLLINLIKRLKPGDPLDRLAPKITQKLIYSFLFLSVFYFSRGVFAQSLCADQFNNSAASKVVKIPVNSGMELDEFLDMGFGKSPFIPVLIQVTNNQFGNLGFKRLALSVDKKGNQILVPGPFQFIPTNSKSKIKTKTKYKAFEQMKLMGIFRGSTTLIHSLQGKKKISNLFETKLPERNNESFSEHFVQITELGSN